MNPKWNAMALMVLGSALTLFAYVTSLLWADTAFEGTLGIVVMVFGMLTVASGVVLAYLHFFRADVARPARRF